MASSGCSDGCVVMFESVLVANRGEIAVRVMRTLRGMGIRSVAVYSDADVNARHVQEADTAVRLGPATARESYLHVERVVAAAVASGAQAIHPGYGFLSENPALAEACAAAGIVFVGPPVTAILAMADKIAAKQTVKAAGVRVVPGRDEAGLDDTALAAAALEIGLPVLLKPSAGGGGKGMRLVEHPDDLSAAIVSARREARSSFGDDTILVERFVRNPRHIEIQVVGDTFGNVVHLGERECSLQRRHQKIIEEAPSPFITPAVREAMGAQAVAAARACGYTSTGTVEFIVSADAPDDFFFMEMNTRLQVEHPVTEMIYGVDLVEAQLRIAAGEPLPWTQAELVASGHAIEARVYAEDPARGFLPTGGTIVALHEPTGSGVRVDSGVMAGGVVGSDYDPMLAKIIAHGANRAEALRRLDGALASTALLGVTTNIGFLRRLLADEDVQAGRLDTGLVERRLDALTAAAGPTSAAIEAAALWPIDVGPDAWRALTGWRLGGGVPVRARLDVAGHGLVSVEADARSAAEVIVHPTSNGLWIGDGGSAWLIRRDDPRRVAAAGGAVAGGVVRSPMPGTVIAVGVVEGDHVRAGQTVAVVEAMKMEHTLIAAIDGVVATVHAAVGQSVALDAPIITITPTEGAES
jgi:acetyl-CoA/propionyl-CoA carboxylase, biotin carboxylase, biotin carboxyl carrier protein